VTKISVVTLWLAVWLLDALASRGKILRSAQNDTCGVVILNPSAVLRMNSVKDLILNLSHYQILSGVDGGAVGRIVFLPSSLISKLV
jgi:uncharacterized protein involved in response to NO